MYHFHTSLRGDPECRCPKGSVIVTIKVVNVSPKIAVSHTTVLSVAGPTGLLIVIFVANNLSPHSQRLSHSPTEQLPTPVKIDLFVPLLDGYTPSTIEYLKLGFRCGFRLDYSGPSFTSHPRNLMSVLNNPSIVDAKLEKELSSHRLAGPFASPPFDPFVISPLGIVPKKSPGEFRLIHNLSHPRGYSVNDGILPEDSSVSYATIDDEISFIRSVGRNCFLAKTDIKHAFRIIPIHPKDYHLLGIFWKDMYFYDRCLPMGCSSSCKIFETFSTAVEWVARNKYFIRHILHLLDDFL